MAIFIGINGEPSSGAPFVLWTMIFSSIGTKRLTKKKLIYDSKDVNKINVSLEEILPTDYMESKHINQWEDSNKEHSTESIIKTNEKQKNKRQWTFRVRYVLILVISIIIFYFVFNYIFAILAMNSQ